MKRSFCFAICLMFIGVIYANDSSRFLKDVSNEHVSTESASMFFSEWLQLPEKNTFELVRDEVDDLGFRHQTYQQFYDGITISSHLLMVHSKNGEVQTINGHVLSNLDALNETKISKRQALARTKSKNSDAELVIIYTESKGYRKAYKMLSEDGFAMLYVDVEDGEILVKESLIQNYDVSGTAATMYSGTQAITCYKQNNLYYLLDSARNIITYDASKSNYEFDLESFVTPAGTLDTPVVSSAINDYLKTCYTISSTSSNFSSSYNLYLTKVTIPYVLQNSSWYVIGEGTADVYIKIKDEKGNLLYTSGYKDDPTFPTSFTISSNVEVKTTGYTIELWDYDPTGSDDYIGQVSINGYYGTKYEYENLGSVFGMQYTIEPKGVQPALDVHWGISKTLDFYKNVLKRKGFDGKGSIVYNVVDKKLDNFFTDPFNACALSIPPYPMFYGMGGNIPGSINSMSPVVSIDITAHEFTHLLINTNGNGGLTYLRESGALNESFADIIGYSVKASVKTSDWLIGNEVMLYASNVRSLKNPELSLDGNAPQPKTYFTSPYWQNVPDSVDHGGVHTNSGVQNYWYYLLCQGGSGTNNNQESYSITGIGIDKGIQIAYRNLLYYLTPDATFFDARLGSIQAAKDLYGSNSTESQTVAAAWDAVGVYGPSLIKAKKPSNWGNTIRAWVWKDGENGSWVTPTKENDWYCYTGPSNKFNIIFVNGTTWSGDNNQTIDISVSKDMCIQIGNNTSGKRTYTSIDCDDSTTDQYYILAKRKTGDYYYLTPTSVSDKDRLVAVDAGDSVLTRINTSSAPSTYLWTIEPSGNGVLLKNGAKYLYSTAAKSAKLNTTGLILTKRSNADGTTSFVYAKSATENWYLSLANKGSDYFVFYANENQITHLVLVAKSQTPTEIISPSSSSERRKVFINGQVYIIVDGKQYDLLGRQVL